MASSAVIEGDIWGSRRSRSQRASAFGGSEPPAVFATSSTSERRSGIFAGETVFSRRSSTGGVEDDEEALKWAALEKLPTYSRLRTAILQNVEEETGKVLRNEVDVTKLGIEDRQALIEKILRVTEEDNERFLKNVRDRIDRVGIQLPKIEVRFEHLNITAKVHVGQRALPSLVNYSLNLVEEIMGMLGLAPSNKRKLQILQDVTGIIKPSRMTLLLGPPNAGKTTLLKALAGKSDPDLKVSGLVTYNGHRMDEFVPEKTAAYISQNDLQDGEMTVRETLDFYGRCQGVGDRFDMLLELSRREKQAGIKPDADVDLFMKAAAVKGLETSVVTDYIMKILGLDICADTLVGDEMRRGISGGQRKRVTTGEMLVGPARALLMDEISTGLDSSTTFQIVKCLRQSVHFFNGTMVVSLLQPAPETYALFDDLILLSEGQIVYQGPCDLVLDFFESMGFKCPDRKGVADFLQEVTSKKDQEQYWADKSTPYTYVSVKDFSEAFLKFHVGERLMEECKVPYDKATSHPAALVKEKYALSKWELFIACFAREWLLMQRNSFVYVFKTVQITFVAVVTMTVFLRTEMHQDTVTDGTKYLGALFFGLINVMFNGFAELSMTIMRLPVFYKQRDLFLYPPWAFTLPIWVMRIPMSLVESGIWIVLTYYVVGFAPEAGRFFRQFLLLFMVHQMSLGLFRLIASVGRSMVVANTFGSFALLVVFVLGGFIVSRNDIHPWWIWGYWISPLMYGQNGISVNEFLSPRWQKPYNNSATQTVGEQVLESRGIFPKANWFWIAIGALIGYNILFNILFTWTLAWLNPLGTPQAVLSEETLDEKHANLTGEELPSRVPSSRKSMSSHGNGTGNAGRRSSISSATSERLDAIEEAGGVPGKRGMVLPFQQLAIAFHNLNYYVDMPAEMKEQGVTEDRLQLLRGISGAFKPGVLTALVGVSGAGKTTLMDVLAGRKTGGYIEGTVSISGYPKNQETFARIAGYCEQNDIHSPYVTVYESLVFSAWLRLSSEVNFKTRMMFVDEVMELVELTSLKDALVGLPGVNGLSTEQRKRLTIAVELVANPSIIFMDEPTSGLDARAAAIVMRAVRNTVDTGRTVVCTIHQPSIDIFEAFDELLLMKRGGQVIYAGALGTHSKKLVEYFEAVEGVPPIKEGYNPATWMLEVTSTSQETRLGIDFAQVYRESSLFQRNEALVEELSIPPAGSKELYFPTRYSQSFATQCMATLWKQHKSYWRNPLYNVIRLFFTTVCAVMFGTIFWDLGQKRSSFQNLFNLMGSMYAAVLFIGVNNSSSVQPVVGVERTVFYREKAAGMYSALPYAFGQVVIELPYVLVQTLVYGVIVYAMINFEWTAAKFFYFIFFTYFTFLYFTLYGMMTVSFTPNHQVAAIVSSAFYGVWNLFAGFLIPRPQIPIWWRWYYWGTPIAWSLYGLITSQLGDVETLMNTPLAAENGTTERTVKVFLEEYFGFHYNFLGWVAAVHVGLVVLFGFVFAFSIKYLNFQRR